MNFILDTNRALTYEELLTHINGAVEIPTTPNGGDLIDFAKDFFAAIAKSADIELSELNPEECKCPNRALAKATNFKTADELVAAVKKSASKIALFTSGTTGRPKRILHTVESLARNVKIGADHFGDVWGFCYSPAHMAGLQVMFQIFFNKNFCVNLFDKKRGDIYSQIEKNSITHISATPTFYRLLLPFEKKFESVKRITLGGEKSDKNLFSAAAEIFPNAKIANIYASTEAAALLASSGEYFKIPQRLREHVKIEEDELLLHKSLLGQSSELALENDFYSTGDMVEFIDEQKKLFRFSSRKNDFVNVGGYKVNPSEVEEKIKSISAVADARVFGKKNSVLGSILCADIKLLPNENLSETDVRLCLSKSLTQFKIPRMIRFVKSLQLTETGKVKRQ